MADSALTIQQINVLMQTLTMGMLGLDPAKPASAYAVRLSWPTGGAPAWKVTEDVAFLRCLEVDDGYNRQRETDFNWATSTQSTRFTRVWSISWTFYGPNSFSNAQSVRDLIFYQQQHDTLAQSNLFLIPDIMAPRRAPELFADQWWERTDLTLSFNEAVTRDTVVNAIESATIELLTPTTTTTIIVPGT